MSQSNTPNPAPKAEVSEQVLYDGSPSWVGRMKAFVLTWILAAVLLVVPILLQVWASGVPWWTIAIGVVLALVLVLGQTLYHRSIRYRITNYRIDFERGMLTRRIDSLELWHADDLHFRQTLLERMMGVGSIEVISDDKSSPTLRIRAVPNGRALFDRIKSAILSAKRHRGLLQLDQ